jgi:hypothetical protein
MTFAIIYLFIKKSNILFFDVISEVYKVKTIAKLGALCLLSTYISADFRPQVTLDYGHSDNVFLTDTNKQSDSYKSAKAQGSYFTGKHEVYADYRITKYDEVSSLDNYTWSGEYVYLLEEGQVERVVGASLFSTEYDSDGVITDDENFSNTGVSLFYEKYTIESADSSFLYSPELSYASYSDLDRNDIDLKLLVELKKEVMKYFFDAFLRNSSDNYFSYSSVMGGLGVTFKRGDSWKMYLNGSYRYKYFFNRELSSTESYFTSRRGGGQGGNLSSPTKESHHVIRLGGSVTYSFNKSASLKGTYNYEVLSSNNDSMEYTLNEYRLSFNYRF